MSLLLSLSLLEIRKQILHTDNAETSCIEMPFIIISFQDYACRSRTSKNLFIMIFRDKLDYVKIWKGLS